MSRAALIRFAKLLGLLCAIPVFGVVASYGLELHFASKWSSWIEQATAGNRQDLAFLRSVGFADLCGRTDVTLSGGLKESCSNLDDLIMLRWGSLIALLAGPGLIALIAGAARVARGRRRLLAAIFSPGLRIVVIALFLLVIAQSAIAFFGLIFAETELLGSVHSFTVLVGIGGLIGAVLILKNGMAFSKRVTTQVVGITSTPDRHPRLHALIAEIAKRVGAAPPHHTVLGLDPTFYATAAEVAVIGEKTTHRGETLYLSLPLMRILTRGELTGVIGHELAHFAGDDVDYSLKFYPIFRGSSAALDAVYRHGQRGSMGLAILPAAVVLDFFVEQFTVTEREIGRERELAADQGGAKAASAEDLARALLKTGGVGGLWPAICNEMIGLLNAGRSLINVSERFEQRAAGMKIAKEALTHTMTHRPTRIRRRPCASARWAWTSRRSMPIWPSPVLAASPPSCSTTSRRWSDA